MGALSQERFDELVNGGCPSCNGRLLEIRSVIDRSLVMMAGTPNDAGRWAHDGEKFVDGTYAIKCTSCAHVVFESDMCPRCNADGALGTAVNSENRFVVPKRCPTCKELELLAIAMVPAVARYGAGETPKPKPLVEFGDAGYHLVAYACHACDQAKVADGCPLCGSMAPLRPRP
jgi:ssDNA-binding Zn-finger/Zn-ribbon topoisomerase 1